jgi:hypothetical protein
LSYLHWDPPFSSQKITVPAAPLHLIDAASPMSSSLLLSLLQLKAEFEIQKAGF